MERVSKRLKIFITSELKTLFKQCFRNPLYAQVPFEVWLDIVWKMPLQAIFAIVASCKAFKELVDKHLKHDVRFALLCRREDQIPLARRCLKMCAKDGDPTAILHLALVVGWGGWGLSLGKPYINNCFEIMIDSGNVYVGVMWWVSSENDIIKYNEHTKEYDNKIEELLRKTPSWKLIVHIGNAVFWKGGMYGEHVKLAVEYLEPLANDGDEFAQFLLGRIYSQNRRKSLYWHTKAAEQGNYMSIKQLSFMYSARDKQERALFEKYSYKARLQQNL